MKTTQLTDDQERQLAPLDALADTAIDLTDIPDQGARTGWVKISEVLRPQ